MVQVGEPNVPDYERFKIKAVRVTLKIALRRARGYTRGRGPAASAMACAREHESFSDLRAASEALLIFIRCLADLWSAEHSAEPFLLSPIHDTREAPARSSANCRCRHRRVMYYAISIARFEANNGIFTRTSRRFGLNSEFVFWLLPCATIP